MPKTYFEAIFGDASEAVGLILNCLCVALAVYQYGWFTKRRRFAHPCLRSLELILHVVCLSNDLRILAIWSSWAGILFVRVCSIFAIIARELFMAWMPVMMDRIVKDLVLQLQAQCEDLQAQAQEKPSQET